MRVAQYFLCYLILALLLASLVAYPLFETLQYTQLHRTVLGQLSFRKLVDRLYLVSVFIAIIYLVKRHRLENLRTVGLVVSPGQGLAGFAKGFFLGLLLIALSGFVLEMLAVRYRLDNVIGNEWPGLLLTSFLAGLSVAFIEETFFRGVLLSKQGRVGVSWAAVLISSLLYATVHFAEPEWDPSVDEVSWTSAFAVLMSAFHKLSEPQFIGSFLTLFIFGAYLCFLRMHYRHLWVSIGVHAGAVISLKLLFEMTRVDKQASLYWLVGNYDHITGYLTALLLFVALLGHWLLTRKVRLTG